ncbi:MAG: hypothetical protein AB7S38_30895 [Vulcanimicrobiota bacterium]
MRIPSWAAADVRAFLDSGRLPGGQRQSHTKEVAEELDQALAGSLDQVHLMDESPADLAGGQPGLVAFKRGQFKVTSQYQGSAQQGCLVQYVDALAPTYFECHFTPERVDAIWVEDTSGGLVAQGLHLDRHDPSASYSELRA